MSAGKETTFTHLDNSGKARMVDVSGKSPVRRIARAKGKIFLSPSTVVMVKENSLKKGDVLAVAKIAGISGAKRTSDLIPLCHNIEIEYVDISFSIAEDGIEIESECVCTDKTGIEMEALNAVSVAALTIWDMCKAVDDSMKISDITLVEKRKERIDG